MEFPIDIFSGYHYGGHCQGIAVDEEKGYIYYSFTTLLIKSDLHGNIIGSVRGLLGHLGCIDFYPDDGCVYGSLEYKNDEIGKGVLECLGSSATFKNAFYCAIFDVDKIDRMDMDAKDIMRTVYLPDVVSDYLWTDGELEHKYGCSGIDGTAVGKMFGDSSRTVLTICYGIYGDNSRTDNDHQVLLSYDFDALNSAAKPLIQENMHTSSALPISKKFVHTGNTDYGIQNLEYDKITGEYFAAVYFGHKPEYANMPMYVFSADKDPKVIRALDFKYGATGMKSLTNGLWYFSEDGHCDKGWYTHVHLYKKTDFGFKRL